MTWRIRWPRRASDNDAFIAAKVAAWKDGFQAGQNHLLAQLERTIAERDYYKALCASAEAFRLYGRTAKGSERVQ